MHYTCTVLSQGNSLFRYASHSNLPTSSRELSSVALRAGPSAGLKAKPNRSIVVSSTAVEHADC